MQVDHLAAATCTSALLNEVRQVLGDMMRDPRGHGEPGSEELQAAEERTG